MIFIAFHETDFAVKDCITPHLSMTRMRFLGFITYIIHTKAMSLNIGLVDQQETIAVAEVIPQRWLRIV
ncbi:hypothetical protein IMSAGC021_01530 [Muribaculaceae bacterium]|nr:hypothetical protein IMSAGC021_01530 [Muribaculaceae bacterium]